LLCSCWLVNLKATPPTGGGGKKFRFISKVLVEHFTVRFRSEAVELGRLVARWLPRVIPALRVELARYKPDKADHPRR
jgi:hypothetical protein